MEKRVVFKNKVLPYLLLAPQIIITLVFFIWPATQAIYQSVLQEDAFGLSRIFVGLDNFKYIFSDRIYYNSIYVTAIFSISVAAISMSVALLLAVLADRAIRGATTYKTLIIWPYAVAPVVSAVLWYFLFNPTVGMIAFFLKSLGVDWNYALNGTQAMVFGNHISRLARNSLQFSVLFGRSSGDSKIFHRSCGDRRCFTGQTVLDHLFPVAVAHCFLFNRDEYRICLL